jgi:hypothetical protein
MKALLLAIAFVFLSGCATLKDVVCPKLPDALKGLCE